MRVLVDARISRRWDAGVGRYTCSLLDALASSNHEFILFTNSDAATPPLNVAAPKVVPSRIPVASVRQQLELPWRFHDFRPDVVLATHPLAATRFALSPSVAVVLDLYPLHFPDQFPKLVPYYYASVFSHIARHKHALIAISESTKRDVVARLGVSAERIAVTPLAASAVFRPISPVETAVALRKYGMAQPYILYHGNKRRHKNVPGLIAAFAVCVRRFPALLLAITGREDPSDREADFTEIRQTVDRLHLQKNVQYTGMVPDLDLPSLYSGAALTAIPSFLEGFGLPALESMACGTPVVASNTGALPEVVGDGGLLVNPYDTSEIALAMLTILNDPEVRASLRSKALAWAEQFSWTKTAQRTMDVLESVASGVS